MMQSGFDDRFSRAATPPSHPSERSEARRRALAGWCLVVGIVVLATTVWGVARHFSSMPYMDQWDGMIGFWRRLQNGDTAAWWAQHNEHRIVFTRALFWIDFHFFRGLGYLLVPANIVLHLAVAAVFVFGYLRYATRKHSTWVILGIVLATRFPWMQGENFTWGFQSQFIAVYLFANASFLAYSRTRPGASATPQIFAFAMAFASMISMTNGLVAFPILVAMSFFLGLPWRHRLVAMMCTLVAWAIYFHGYRTPAFHASPAEGLLHHPGMVLNYALIFLGSPAEFLGAGSPAPLIAGVMLVGIMIAMGFVVLRNRELNSYRLYLVATFSFAGAAALLAASGRYELGYETAIATRYTTPALIAWLSAFLLFADVVKASWFWKATAVISVTALPALVWSQRAMLDMPPYPYYRDVAVLGMKMGVRDPAYLDWMFPRTGQKVLIDLMQYADREKLSVYSKGWVPDVGKVRFTASSVDDTLCRGSFDAFKSIDGAWLLNGWAMARDDSHAKLIVLADRTGATVGYGVLGEVRPDVAGSVDGAGAHTGWRGYVVHSNGPVGAYLYTSGKFCALANNVEFDARH